LCVQIAEMRAAQNEANKLLDKDFADVPYGESYDVVTRGYPSFVVHAFTVTLRRYAIALDGSSYVEVPHDALFDHILIEE
jgi:hypothetical protein